MAFFGNLCKLLMVFTISLYTSGPILYSQFKFINIAFPEGMNESAIEYIEKEYYRNVTMNGIKVDEEDNVYVSFPRWKDNVPITLAKYIPSKNLFEAYPSWEMNSMNNTDVTKRINSVLGFEIDRKNRMWILDQSHISGQTPAPIDSTKLIIYDMKKKEVEYIYHFDDETAPRTTSFLNDLVIDPKKEVAYISDSGIGDPTNPESFNPGIIIFDYKTKTAKRVLSKHYSVMMNETLRFKTSNQYCLTNSPMETGVDGIALTCDYERLYFCPLSSHKIYGINTQVLLTGDKYDIDNSVYEIGDRGTVSDGLVLGAKGNMYFGNIEFNGVIKTNETYLKSFISSKKDNNGILPRMSNLVSPSNTSTTMIWQDTFALTKKKYLWWTTNNLCNWLNGFLDYENYNYHIFKYKVNERSYMDGCYEAPPPPPNPGNKTNSVQAWEVSLIVGGCVVAFTCACVCVGCVILSAAVVICTKKQVGDYEKL